MEQYPLFASEDDRLAKFTDEVVKWANGISPGRHPRDTVIKMVSESSELLDAIHNKSRADVEDELGDMIILLCDIAHMSNVDLIAAGRKKMEINRNRKWSVDKNVIRRLK